MTPGRGAGHGAQGGRDHGRGHEPLCPLPADRGAARPGARPGARDDLPALVATLKARHAGDTVLVVAHSDTIPPLLKLWGHEASVEVGKAEFNSLWLVVPREGKPPLVSRLKL